MSVLTFLRNPSERLFKRKILFIFTFIVLDAVVTSWLVTEGFGEVNPVMNLVLQVSSSIYMAIIKIVWSLVLLVLIVETNKFKEYINYLIVSYITLYIGGWLYQILWEVYKWTQLTNG